MENKPRRKADIEKERRESQNDRTGFNWILYPGERRRGARDRDTIINDNTNASSPRAKSIYGFPSSTPTPTLMRTPPTPASIDCLSGLSFVFTGELPGFSRDEAISLAKRYGG